MLFLSVTILIPFKLPVTPPSVLIFGSSVSSEGVSSDLHPINTKARIRTKIKDK